MGKFDLAIKRLSEIVRDIEIDGFGNWAIPDYEAAIKVLEAAEKVPKGGVIEMTHDKIVIYPDNQEGWNAWADYVQQVFGPSLPDEEEVCD